MYISLSRPSQKKVISGVKILYPDLKKLPFGGFFEADGSQLKYVSKSVLHFRSIGCVNKSINNLFAHDACQSRRCHQCNKMSHKVMRQNVSYFSLYCSLPHIDSHIWRPICSSASIAMGVTSATARRPSTKVPTFPA